MNIRVKTLTKYDEKTADRIRELLIQLSRSHKDRGEIPKEWFDDLIASPSHDLLIAVDDDGEIYGIATLSIIMGPIVRKVAYLEDFVVDESARGHGLGTILWTAMLSWAKGKGCRELCFTSGHGREPAQKFYLDKGAEIYDTNYFRKII